MTWLPTTKTLPFRQSSLYDFQATGLSVTSRLLTGKLSYLCKIILPFQCRICVPVIVFGDLFLLRVILDRSRHGGRYR